MHYTRSYYGLHRDAKRQMALRDCKEYLGATKYQQVLQDFRNCLRGNPRRTTVRFLEGCLSMGGIQGYPARAFTLHALATRDR